MKVVSPLGAILQLTVGYGTSFTVPLTEGAGVPMLHAGSSSSAAKPSDSEARFVNTLTSHHHYSGTVQLLWAGSALPGQQGVNYHLRQTPGLEFP